MKQKKELSKNGSVVAEICVLIFFIAFLALAATGCAGAVRIPELSAGDRIVIQFDRAERNLSDPETTKRYNQGS